MVTGNIVVQSDTERRFAEKLKHRGDVRLFVKLPGWFKVLTPVGNYTYKVTKDPFPVEANDFSVIAQTPGHTLTLTTCHPKGSARQRLVVKAELESPTANQPAHA